MSGEESTIGFALGIAASIVFVISYIPQLRSLDNSDKTSLSMSMFALQLLSGGIWTTYGIIEKSVSVILFGALATILRLWILRSLLCGAPRSGCVILAGGGDLPNSIWQRVAASSNRSRVLVLSWAEENPKVAKEKEEQARRRLWWAGCTVTTDVTKASTSRAIWMTGGSSSRLIKKLDQNPQVKRRLLELPGQGGFVGGTSAGAVALGTRGIGLVPFDVCVHATQRSATYCINEQSALVIAQGVMRTVGFGGLYARIRNTV